VSASSSARVGWMCVGSASLSEEGAGSLTSPHETTLDSRLSPPLLGRQLGAGTEVPMARAHVQLTGPTAVYRGNRLRPATFDAAAHAAIEPASSGGLCVRMP
jgi:hypothetical protein